VVEAPQVAVVATVRDEAATIDDLLQSLLGGRRLPDEIAIVDAGSTDGTWEVLQRWAGRVPALQVQSVPGCGRSEGRNRAIAATTAPWIAVTDGGVRLDPGWLEALLAPLAGPDRQYPDTVSGFFRMAPVTLFELALGATTLPVAREIRPARFLPSSRSVLFSRAAWAAAGGYPVWLDYGEDVVFDLAVRRAGARAVWAPRALAYFRPRSSLGQFYRQYYRYARGDGKALLWPRRHAIRYASYTGLLLLVTVIARSGRRPPGLLAAGLLGLGAAAYLRAPFERLARPDDRSQRVHGADFLTALALLPVLRLTGDLAKMAGYPAGRLWRLRRRATIPGDPTRPHHVLHRSTAPS
jgi:glycosyltransferase involved in cell wall biosynthesis